MFHVSIHETATHSVALPSLSLPASSASLAITGRGLRAPLGVGGGSRRVDWCSASGVVQTLEEFTVELPISSFTGAFLGVTAP